MGWVEANPSSRMAEGDDVMPQTPRGCLSMFGVCGKNLSVDIGKLMHGSMHRTPQCSNHT